MLNYILDIIVLTIHSLIKQGLLKLDIHIACLGSEEDELVIFLFL